jgi:transglutaminase-like putative cysteine protease
VASLALVPQHTRVPYRGTTDTVANMQRLSASPRGECSLRLRMTVEEIVRDLPARDRLSQMAAIYDWLNRHWSYLNDPVEDELVKDPERFLEEIASKGRALGDCDDAATFLHAAFRTIGIPAEFARAGFGQHRGLGDKYTHVFVVAPDQYGRRIVVDPVAGARTGEMVARATRSVVGTTRGGADLARLDGLSGGEDLLVAPVVIALGAFFLLSMAWSGGT